MAAQDSSDDGIITGINVTPFVDVVLVLLVIFMVTAPILAKDVIQIKLPKTVAGDGKGLSPIGVAINRQGQILLNGELLSEESLTEQMKQALAVDDQVQAIISADVDVNYGLVAKVIDLVKTSGVTRFAIQVEHTAN
jgi:biopolymer transport protein TolR